MSDPLTAIFWLVTFVLACAVVAAGAWFIHQAWQWWKDRRYYTGWQNQHQVALSCGHVLYVNGLSRYGRAKTMGCPICKEEATKSAP